MSTADIVREAEINHRGAAESGFLGDNLFPSIKSGFNAVSDSIPQESKFMSYAAFGLAALTGAIMVPKLLNMTQMGGVSRFAFGSIAIAAIALIGGGTLGTMFKGNDFGEAFGKTMGDVGKLLGLDHAADAVGNAHDATTTAMANGVIKVADMTGVDPDIAAYSLFLPATWPTYLGANLVLPESQQSPVSQANSALGPNGLQTADITPYSNEDGITLPAGGKIVAIQHKSDMNAGASGQNATSSFVVDHGNGVYSRYQAEIDKNLLGSELSANEKIEASVDVTNANALGEGVVARELLIQENSSSQTYNIDPNGHDINALVGDKSLQQEAVEHAKELAVKATGDEALITSSYQAPLASPHVQEFNSGSGVLLPKGQPPIADTNTPAIEMAEIEIPEIRLDPSAFGN